MATTLTKLNPSWVRSTSNRALETEANLVDGSATWKAGEFLRRASDGLLYECQTSAAAGIAADAITHYALQDLDTAIAADTTRLEVGIVHADDIWELQEKTGAITEAIKGMRYGMYVNTNWCALDIGSGTTNVVFQVVQVTWRERPYQDASSDIYARLTATVLYNTIHAQPAS